MYGLVDWCVNIVAAEQRLTHLTQTQCAHCTVVFVPLYQPSWRMYWSTNLLNLANARFIDNKFELFTEKFLTDTNELPDEVHQFYAIIFMDVFFVRKLFSYCRQLQQIMTFIDSSVWFPFHRKLLNVTSFVRISRR